MALSLPFTLHVRSSLGSPDIGSDYIQYPALAIIKLEAGTFTTAPTGIIIASCDTTGTILVTICDKYKDSIQISHNNFDPYHSQPIVVQLYNCTDQYIRINTDEKIFKYQWVPTAPVVAPVVAPTDPVGEPVAEPIVSADDDENTTTNTSESADSEEHAIATSNDENTAPTDQTTPATEAVSTDRDENSIIEDQSAPTQTNARRIRRIVKKRVI